MTLWQSLIIARDRLRKGDVVGIPTETVYGLAGSIDRPEAIEKIFSLKKRPFFDPLIVHIASISQLDSLVPHFPAVAKTLAAKFWPGPLTMVLPRRENLNPMICSGLDTVAIRFPSHPLARRLIKTVGVPLAAPSANIFGRTSPTTASHVRTEWSEEELFIIDGGPCRVGLESTVISFGSTGSRLQIEILRPGAVTEEMLKSALAENYSGFEVSRAESIASPGHLKHHYMPTIPLVILREGTPFNTESLVKIRELLAIGEKFVKLHLNPRPEIAARELYAMLRELSNSGADFIVVERKKEMKGDFWDAIWDRLERAASYP